jgi:hypothetical protein
MPRALKKIWISGFNLVSGYLGVSIYRWVSLRSTHPTHYLILTFPAGLPPAESKVETPRHKDAKGVEKKSASGFDFVSSCLCVSISLMGFAALYPSYGLPNFYLPGGAAPGQGMIGTALTLFLGDPSISLSL